MYEVTAYIEICFYIELFTAPLLPLDLEVNLMLK